MNPDINNSIVLDTSQVAPAQKDALRTYAMVVYALFAAGPFLGGLPTIVGLVMAYIKRDEMTGTIYKEHMGLLIRSFWISLILGILGALTMLLVVGIFILIGTGIWYIYRIVRGFIRFNEGKGIW